MTITQDLVCQPTLVGPEQANQMRSTMYFERQRNMSEANIARIAHEMEMGRFIPGTQVYIAVLPSGKMLILNGNHTLQAIIACRRPQLLDLTYKQVSNMDAAGNIYAVFDLHKTRTWRDSLRSVGKEGVFADPTHVLPAIGLIDDNFAQSPPRGSVSRVERFAFMEQYKDAAEMAVLALSGAPREVRRYFTRAAVLAVALETIRYQPSAASEFWYKASHDDGLTIGMPERALLSWLRNTQSVAGQDSRKEHARAAALAWNAKWRGLETQYVKPNAMGSFYLLGTPWHNGLPRASKSPKTESPAREQPTRDATEEPTLGL